MVVEHISGNQLSPAEVQFIAQEFGCTPEQVRSGQLPGQPVNQQYTPQYNPYQQMQGYGYRPMYPQQQPMVYQPMYNQYGQIYQSQYPVGYTPTYQNYQQPNTIYPQQSYYPQYNMPVQDAYGKWYSSYTEMMMAQPTQQLEHQYRDQILEGNPFASYIQLVADYNPNPNTTYFGYNPQFSYNQSYGLTMDEEERRIFQTQDKYLENQKKIFESLSRGAMIASGQNVDEINIQQYYKEQLTPDYQVIKENNNPLNVPDEILNLRDAPVQWNYYKELNRRSEELFNYRKNNTIAAMNKKMDEVRKETPETMTLSQFLDIGGKLYGDAMFEDFTNKYRKDLTNAYVSAHYNASVKPPINDPNYYNTMMKFGQTDVGDICISTPAFLLRNYEERRQRFINACINGGSNDNDIPF